MYAANNFISDNTGHAFDVSTNGYVLAEGNYFSSVTTPNADNKDGHLFVPTSAGDCMASIGRNCELNVLKDSRKFSSIGEDAVATQLATYKKQIGRYKVVAASELAVASGNFGVGELGNSVAQSTASSGTGTNATDASTASQETEASSANQETTEPPTATDLPTQGSAATEGTNAPAATDAPAQIETSAPATENLKRIPRKKE